MQFVYLSCLMVVLWSCNKKDNFDKEIMLTNIGSQVILPALESFEEQTAVLLQKVEGFVENPTKSALKEAQNAWITVAAEWSYSKNYMFGIAKDQYLHLNIGKNPINPNAIDKFIQTATSIRTSDLKAQSSYAKGVFAIEYLLYAEGLTETELLAWYTTDPLATNRKAYLTATAERLRINATAWASIWKSSEGNYIAEFGTALGEDLQGAVSLLSNALINVCNEMARLNLGQPLGKEAADGSLQFNKLESLYAYQSAELLIQKLKGMKAAFTGKVDIGFDDYLNHLNNEETLSVQIETKLNLVIRQLEALGVPLREALVSKNAEVEQIYATIKALLVYLNTDMASYFNITVLPSDSDGD